MSVLNFQERMFVKAMYRELMASLHGDAFEDFFHRLMSARYPDFVQVRTHGNIGDLSADGLRLHNRVLGLGKPPLWIENGGGRACNAVIVFDAICARTTGWRRSRFRSTACVMAVMLAVGNTCVIPEGVGPCQPRSWGCCDRF